MKQIVTGIVAHVDAGKTTLSEALLYRTGEIRQAGRVDNGDAFLDTDSLEKKRGITIFSHQAHLQFDQTEMTVLDTPGHVDFAFQTEQVLSVLDYAILVISASDGVQGYTRTLWNLLEKYNVPTVIFVNKMDMAGVNKREALDDVRHHLSDGAVEFTDELNATTREEIAMQNESVLDQFIETGTVTDQNIQTMIQNREIFPVYFGSALKLEGIESFLNGIDRWTVERSYHDEFGAHVFKISHDEKGERLTWVRVTGGVLHNKAVVFDGQKANQLRVYNGQKFELRQDIPAGGVCAISGLTGTFPGQGLGTEDDSGEQVIQPLLNYALDPQDNDINDCLDALRVLEDENPQLKVTWSNHLQEIHVLLMGPVQLEVIQQLMAERFKLSVGFDEGNILYKETINSQIEGVGHFEPLRHYAEVHLLLEPGAPGSGMVFDTDCSVDLLTANYQQQVLTNLRAKEQLGVLTGSPLTDVKITLINGRSHIKHTEGGDFREATWRAVRQGLMELKQQNTVQLLEPWYRFRLTIPQDQVGRAMNDIQKMNGEFETPQTAENGDAILTGTAPVSEMRDYAQEVRSYTHGAGQFDTVLDGYQPCHNADEVISERNYDPVADLENTPDSVFCAHGAGYPVPWNEVPQMAHLSYADD